MKYTFVIGLVFIFTSLSGQQIPVDHSSEKQLKSAVDYVNPFIGTGGHGHTFPGATLPFGMVQLSPDTRLTGWDGCSGYHYTDKHVYGFSHTHLSGTGVSDYGDILLMPTTGDIRMNNGVDGKPGYRSAFKKSNEEASAGYYRTYLEDYNVNVELTSTLRTGIHKYTFEKGNSGNVIIDLEHRDEVLEAYLEIVNDHEIRGYRLSKAWAEEQYIYFVAKFSKPFKEYGLMKGQEKVDGKKLMGKLVKGYLTFETTENEPILVKVGVSAVNMEGALKNLDREVKNWDFDFYRNEAVKAWETELSPLEVVGGTEDEKTNFYTALYHSYIAPNVFMDVDGKYRGTDLQIHKAEGFTNHTIFSLWDTYRGTHPLYTILQQKRTNDFIKTFLAQFENGGQLPMWELAGNYTKCMIGYHSVSVMADAWMKGIRGFDGEKALEAMVSAAMRDELGIDAYKKYGYITSEEESESVSKTLEYAYNDWCIAQMAGDMGKTELKEKFEKRALAYQHLYDPQTGFFRARVNNNWGEDFAPEEVNYHYTEANAWQYEFYVPQDIDGFMELLGGRDALDAKLDELFTTNSETSGRHQVDITGLIGQYAHGNEPSHHMAYLYSYAGKPWKTQSMVRRIMDEMYTNEPDGLSGNEDCGQMSSWYVLSSMGFYPVTPGGTTYAIGSPLFSKVSLKLENGKTFSIAANKNSARNRYIQSATLNGKPFTKNFIEHATILAGGKLVFEMGPSPVVERGVAESDIPKTSIPQSVTPAPYVSADAVSFRSTINVKLGSVKGDIYYTTDGSEPTTESMKYNQPLKLNRSTTIKAFALSECCGKSPVITSEFMKVPDKWNISILSEYADQYSGGGKLALIDGRRGSEEFRSDNWQGYQKVDMEAILDLGKCQSVKELSLGCLQDQNSWIFMPEQVDFYTSVNGKDYKLAGTVKNSLDPFKEGAIADEFTLSTKTKCRYVKVIAKNRGTCPKGHKGEGENSWIFLDELMVE